MGNWITVRRGAQCINLNLVRRIVIKGTKERPQVFFDFGAPTGEVFCTMEETPEVIKQLESMGITVSSQYPEAS